MQSECLNINRIAVTALFVFGLCGAASAQSHFPLCPIEAASSPLPVLRPEIAVRVSEEALRASLLFQNEGLTFEVRTLPTDQIECVSPLHTNTFWPSFSLLWPYAIDAIDHEFAAHPLPAQKQRLLVFLHNPIPKNRARGRIITVPDVENIQPGELSDPAVAQLTCDSHDIPTLLDGVLRAHDNIDVDFSYASYSKEILCADAAVALEPGSCALQYVAGMANDDHTYTRPSRENHPKNLSAAITHFRAAVTLAPEFYEARRGLAEALQESGAYAEAEKEFLQLAEPSNPPPIQQEAEESLTSLYDAMKDLPHALLAARKAEHLHEILTSLTGNDKDRTMSDHRSNLAAREEEAGEYAQAASDYLAARNFLWKDDFEAKYFDADLGQARSLRKIGNPAASAALCQKWQGKVFSPLHKLNISPWWQWGGGLDVEQARWEFSCGDFNKGLQELFQIANSRLDHPSVNKNYKDEPTPFFMMEPYEALESAFDYRREPEAARQSHLIHQQIYNIDHGKFDIEPDQADIDSLKQLTQKLMSEALTADPPHNPKP